MESGGIHLLNLKKMCKDSFLSVNHLRGVLLQSAARTFQIPSNPLLLLPPAAACCSWPVHANGGANSFAIEIRHALGRFRALGRFHALGRFRAPAAEQKRSTFCAFA